MTDLAEAERFFQKQEKHRKKILSIRKYAKDGFKKVCDVTDYRGKWYYKNIDQTLMFSSHNSWIYFIVENDMIVKCGETGNPLGIKEPTKKAMWEIQPIAQSTSRLGRLRGGDGTDRFIRDELRASIMAGCTVSIWAKKCELRNINECVGGVRQAVSTSIHKSLEQLYLKYFKHETGYLPRLNKATK